MTVFASAGRLSSVLPWRRIGVSACALLLLNGALSFSTWWPTPGILPDHRLSSEFVVLWLLLLLLHAWRGPVQPRIVSLLAGGYLLLVVGRYADVTVPSLFGRQINLYWDGAQIPRFLWVTLREGQWWLALASVLGAVLLLWGLYRLLRWALGVVVREALPRAAGSRWVWVLTLAALAVSVANWAGMRATWPFVSKPVVPTYWRQAQLIGMALSADGTARALPVAAALHAALTAPPGQALGGLGGRDVFIVFLESYGAVAYDHPRAMPRLAAARARLAADLERGGWRVASTFVGSPTFGGASDLAHLSLLSGIDLSDPMRHDLLLTTDRPTLLTLFRAQGYRALGYYPALSWEWPERVWYGFDEFVEARQMHYRGPPLGHWKVPDQVSAAWLDAHLAHSKHDTPSLVFFPTITNHFPFHPVPPYQPDWSRLLSEQPFDPDEVRRAQAQPVDWLDMMPAYVAMMEYSYRWIGDWLRQPRPRDVVFVLLGDHQPTGNISGEGASWDVPVHVVARDPALLARLALRGFAPGLEPPRRRLGGMHELSTMLLEVFAGEPGTSQAATR
jgi:hypothetical protein